MGWTAFAIVALVAAAALLGGCAEAGPAMVRPVQDEPQPVRIRSWSYATWAALGDWAARLDLEAEQPTTCTALLRAQGTTDGDRPEFLVGHVTSASVAVEENSRDIQPLAGYGDVNTAVVSQTRVIGYGPGGGFPTNATFGPGNATVVWAASGVVDVGLMEDGTVVATLECDQPVEIVRRGVSFEALLWNDQTFSDDGYVSPGVGGYGGGSRTAQDADPFLFLFSKFQQESQILSLSSPSLTHTWDLSGDGRVDDARDGLRGPIRLSLRTEGVRPDDEFQPPWTSGLLAAFETVDLLPRGYEATDQWEGQPPG